eukprot:SAG11_NODE_33083_length_279_cov_0.677778_1_plen_71_part_01
MAAALAVPPAHTAVCMQVCRGPATSALLRPVQPNPVEALLAAAARDTLQALTLDGAAAPPKLSPSRQSQGS